MISVKNIESFMEIVDILVLWEKKLYCFYKHIYTKEAFMPLNYSVAGQQ